MKTQDIIVHPANDQEMNVIKAFFSALDISFELSTRDLPYDSEFVAKIQTSRRQAEEGNTAKISLDDIWK